jgi:energy-coupling factor transporter ATP-binding protein EcfA2
MLVILGHNGSGKSRLLKRIQILMTEQPQIAEKGGLQPTTFYFHFSKFQKGESL